MKDKFFDKFAFLRENLIIKRAQVKPALSLFHKNFFACAVVAKLVLKVSFFHAGQEVSAVFRIVL